MSNVNVVILMGNLTRDPEMKYTPQGTAVCDLSMAINYTRGKGDQKKEEVSFFDITAFGKSAENAAEYLKKGRQVIVEGRLQQERWESADGQKRSKVKVIAERITFVGGGGAKESAAPAQDEEIAL